MTHFLSKKRKRPASSSDDSSENESKFQNSKDETISDSDSDSGTEIETQSNQKVVKSKWTDRDKVLLLCSRGSLARTRHLMNDFKRLMPHVHSEAKFDKKENLGALNEIAELSNCSKAMYFESRKGRDVYLWVSNVNGGPSMKFLVHNTHTMNELNLSGNCLKGSRPILVFDSQFDSKVHLKLIKETFKHVFKTPQYHPRSQPFIDHIFNFSITPDGRIWFRNYQVVDEKLELQEIGPRMVLEIIRIFDGPFSGTVLYDNPDYITPNTIRKQLKLKAAGKYENRQMQKQEAEIKEDMIQSVKIEDPVGEVFDTNKEIVGKSAYLLSKEIDRPKSKKKKAKN
uniref:Ribosome biogenesis protein BRX1 homolog n=1 Tax=Acrobeloides nanus TaxID=290746 RepID=A0A914EGD1_9BILA